MLPENKMSTPPTLFELHGQYTQKLALYDEKVASALATNDESKLPEIKALNGEISNLLEKILSESDNSSGRIKQRREELVSTLSRIQRDYNGLSEKTDSLQLLRRIREGETGASHKTFQMYLFFFFMACLGILAIVFFGGRQNIPATTASAVTPPSIAPLV
jgi:hypothetical protein